MKTLNAYIVLSSIALCMSGMLHAAAYHLEQVKQHNDEISCWIIIESKVYDVTKYLGKHPKKGRQELIESCGKDATEGWRLKGQKQKPHSQKASETLKKYEIGEYVNPSPSGL